MPSQLHSSKKHSLPKHIKKTHTLLFSQQDLSQREADLFALMLANMNPKDWEKHTSPTYEFSSTQLSRWLDIEPKALASTLAPVADRLTQKNIGLPVKDSSQEFDFVSIFKRCTYKNRKLTMIPNDELMNEYIEYSNGYALINTASFLGLKGEYSKRLYELLSRFKSSGTFMQTFDIEALKQLFGLYDIKGKLKSGKSSFANNSVFIKRCIKDSIQEIAQNPQTANEILFFDAPDSSTHGYQLFKEGRKLAKLKFQYRWVSTKAPEQTMNLDNIKWIITQIEMKRAQGHVLSVDELHNLAQNYEAIGESQRANKIKAAIESRQESELQKIEIKRFVDEIKDIIPNDNY